MEWMKVYNFTKRDSMIIKVEEFLEYERPCQNYSENSKACLRGQT